MLNLAPPLGASVLPGITRDSVIQIARDMGIEVIEMSVQRAALYLADEVFLTGTEEPSGLVDAVAEPAMFHVEHGRVTRLG